MPCIKFCREVVSDIDIAFQHRGLFVQHFDEADNPSLILSWKQLEKEMIGLAEQYLCRSDEWAEQMEIANRLIRMGRRFKKALLAIQPDLDQPFELPDRFDPPSEFIRDDDYNEAREDERGEEWKRGG